MRERFTTAVTAALLALALTPAPAAAAPRLTSHVVARTSGADVALQVLTRMRGVQLGSTAATVTVTVEGREHPLRIDFGEYSRGVTGADPSSLVVLAMFPIAASAFLRAVRFLSSLGR